MSCSRGIALMNTLSCHIAVDDFVDVAAYKLTFVTHVTTDPISTLFV